MKKTLPALYFALLTCFVKAQLPFIGTSTIIPQNPTTSDFVKIVTHVTTPNLGILVDINHTVTAQQIRLRACYWQGMATAIQTHIDTFMIGLLPAGNYQIDHKVYMSSTQQWCNKTDSNSVAASLTVSAITAIAKNQENTIFHIYPNPVFDRLFIDGNFYSGKVFIFSTAGVLMRKADLAGENCSVDIHELPDALYFIRISDGIKSVNARFVKSGSD